MEVEEIQTPACKFPRVGNNGRNDSSNKIGQKGGGGGGAGLEQYPADDEEDGGGIKRIAFGGGDSRLRGWHHHSSRIYRVSRASGGKDRHSKVVTSKGLRDRRVRLSVSTAIAFYDLQDRLGYDQPSKAVEWLIKAAAEAIAELPSLNSPFSDTTLKQLSDGKRGSAGMDQGLIDSADVELDDGDPNYQHQHQQQQLSLSKSACSSTSETSKGSGLSLSRPDVRVNRVKARERARERAAKEKEKENESLIAGHQQHQQQNVNNPISQNSFTELLNTGLSSVSNNTSSTTASGHQSPAGGGGGEPDLFHKLPARHHQQWPNSTSMSDYFATGFLGGSGASSSRTNQHSSGGFLGQIQLGNSLPQSIAVVPPFSLGGDGNHHHHHHHQELQHYSFLPDHLTTQPGGGNDYNLNFTISSSSLAGFNRGTLQSNSVQPSVLSHHHIQRFSPIDGSNNLPFFTGTATAAPPPPSAASAPLENHHNHHFHHQFAPGFDGRSLQLYHGDGNRHSDQKGKEKN